MVCVAAPESKGGVGKPRQKKAKLAKGKTTRRTVARRATSAAQPLVQHAEPLAQQHVLLQRLLGMVVGRQSTALQSPRPRRKTGIKLASVSKARLQETVRGQRITIATCKDRMEEGRASASGRLVTLAYVRDAKTGHTSYAAAVWRVSVPGLRSGEEPRGYDWRVEAKIAVGRLFSGPLQAVVLPGSASRDGSVVWALRDALFRTGTHNRAFSLAPTSHKAKRELQRDVAAAVANAHFVEFQPTPGERRRTPMLRACLAAGMRVHPDWADTVRREGAVGLAAGSGVAVGDGSTAVAVSIAA